MKNNIVIWFIFLFSSLVYASNDTFTYPFTTIQDTKRFESLTTEIRCVVCQNQSIADSNAPLANDLRHKIYEMILEKKSDDEIKNYLVKRYGEFILLQPRFTATTLILWTFPFIGLMTVFFFLFRHIRACYH